MTLILDLYTQSGFLSILAIPFSGNTRSTFTGCQPYQLMIADASNRRIRTVDLAIGVIDKNPENNNFIIPTLVPDRH